MNPEKTSTSVNLDELKKLRLEKLKKLESMGIHPFAYGFPRTHTADGVCRKQEKDGAVVGTVALAGRLMSLRRMGKAAFAHIMDRSGKIQIYVQQDTVGQAGYDLFRLLDIGDLIGVKGEVFVTKTGETTVGVKELVLLAKSLRPLPIVKEKIQDDEKVVYDAFADKEMRYRQRYVDLIVNNDVRRVFGVRSAVVSAMRRYLEGRGYIEVETPVLQPLYGGAFAQPFVTHHNTLDMDLYLRIADELYLKRLIVGGYEGVFEIAKDFRNEGMDRDHNPEFTMMELYVAFEDYTFMMDLVENMLAVISREVLGTDRMTFQGRSVDLGRPWTRIGYHEAIRKHTGFDLEHEGEDAWRKCARSLSIPIDPSMGKGKIMDAVFSATVEPKLDEPIFVMDYPVDVSPLAKKHRLKEGVVERFEGFVAGKEICNSFSELNDPIDQRERFEEQARRKASGENETMVIDEDFIRAMEYGMPPTAGLGIGIDRLVMLLTDSPSIKDVIFFPHMRSEIL